MDVEKMPENEQKYLNYKEQFTRLNRALLNKFYLEAIFILYAIMEDRTESMLKYAGKWDAYLKSRHSHDSSLHSKIYYFKKLAEAKRSLEHKYFSDELLDSVIEWKDERNRMIHALLKQATSSEELFAIADAGRVLACKLRNRVGNYVRAIKRYDERQRESQ